MPQVLNTKAAPLLLWHVPSPKSVGMSLPCAFTVGGEQTGKAQGTQRWTSSFALGDGQPDQSPAGRIGKG